MLHVLLSLLKRMSATPEPASVALSVKVADVEVVYAAPELMLILPVGPVLSRVVPEAAGLATVSTLLPLRAMVVKL